MSDCPSPLCATATFCALASAYGRKHTAAKKRARANKSHRCFLVEVSRTTAPLLEEIDMSIGTRLVFTYDYCNESKVLLKLAASQPVSAEESSTLPRPLLARPVAASSKCVSAVASAVPSTTTRATLDAVWPRLSKALLQPGPKILGRACLGVEGGAFEHPHTGNDKLFAPTQFETLDEMLLVFNHTLSSDSPGWVSHFVFPSTMDKAAEHKLETALKTDDKCGPKIVLSRLSPDALNHRLRKVRQDHGFKAETAFPRTASRFCGPRATGMRFSWISIDHDVVRVYASEMKAQTRQSKQPPIAVIRGPFLSAHALFEAVENAWPATDKRPLCGPTASPSYWRTSKGSGGGAFANFSRLRTRYMRRKLQHLLQNCAQHPDGCNDGTPLKNVRVIAIERIENHALWDRYSTFRSEARHRAAEPAPHAHTRSKKQQQSWREKSRSIKCDLGDDERYLFHGTNITNINSIVKNGFRLSVDKLSRYGQGIYFTDESCKSHQYCKKETRDGVDVFCLLYCRVYTGRALMYRPDQSDVSAGYLKGMRKPAPGDPVFEARLRSKSTNPSAAAECAQEWDSVIVEPEKTEGYSAQVHREVVIFDPRQVYPEFIVFYRTDDKPGRIDRNPGERYACDCIQTCRLCVKGRGMFSKSRRQWFDCWAEGCPGHHVSLTDMPKVGDPIICEVHSEIPPEGIDYPAACMFCNATGIIVSGKSKRDCEHCDGDGVKVTAEFTRCFRCRGKSRCGGKVNCTLCGNRGLLIGRNLSECFFCDAKGSYEAVSGKKVPCELCAGRGVREGVFSRCNLCDGEGCLWGKDKQTLCDACQGTGSLAGDWSACVKCDAKGHYTPSGESSAKTCEQCNGKGSICGLSTKHFKCDGCGCSDCSFAGSLPGIWHHCCKCNAEGSDTTDDTKSCDVCRGLGSVKGYWQECVYCEGEGFYCNDSDESIDCEFCRGVGMRPGNQYAGCGHCNNADGEYSRCGNCGRSGLYWAEGFDGHHPVDSANAQHAVYVANMNNSIWF